MHVFAEKNMQSNSVPNVVFFATMYSGCFTSTSDSQHAASFQFFFVDSGGWGPQPWTLFLETRHQTDSEPVRRDDRGACSTAERSAFVTFSWFFFAKIFFLMFFNTYCAALWLAKIPPVRRSTGLDFVQIWLGAAVISSWCRMANEVLLIYGN